MTTLHHVLVAVLAVASLLQTSPHEYSTEELPQLVPDFQLERSLFDRAGTPITDNVVHDFVRINIYGATQIVGTHELVVYIDGSPVHSRVDIRFPYSLTWNFKGLLDGPHTMLLMFTNTDDKRGIVQLDLTVQH
jgi:hypothetical protein